MGKVSEVYLLARIPRRTRHHHGSIISFYLTTLGVSLPHTLKSAVFLLYFTCFLWKTLHKVNIIKGLQYCRVLSNNHGFVTPLKVHIAMLLLCPHADLLLLQKRIRSLLLGIGNWSPTSTLYNHSWELPTHIGLIPIYEMSGFYLFSI